MERPDVDTYIKESERIEKMYMDLLEGTSRRVMKCIDDGSTGLQNVQYSICVLNPINEPLQTALLLKYGEWYEACRDIIRENSIGHNSKAEDFAAHYDKIISLIYLWDSVRNSNEKKHLRKEFISCFDSQVSILHSVKPFVESGKIDQKKLATAEMVYSELEYAEGMYKEGLLHQAGISAINALEIYLNVLCEEHNIETELEESVYLVAQKLYESGKADDFDQDMLTVMVSLSSLADKCTNTDEELYDDDIREMIDKITELTFLAFY